MTIIFVRNGEDNTFWIGLVKSSEGFLSNLWFFIAISEEEKGSFFILEDLFNSVVIEGDDSGVDVKDKDEWEDKSLVHI